MRVKERQQRILEIDALYAASLKKVKEKQPKRQPKRLPASELQSKIITDLTEEYIIRPPDEYKSRSYNQNKQIDGLIKHLFVKYPVPDFLCQAIRKDYQSKITYRGMHPDFILWFLALAQGQSFTKLTKKIMTAKEAHMFLSAPYEEIGDNIWWAKLKVADVPDRLIPKLIDRIFSQRTIICHENATEKNKDVILFFANHHQDMDNETFNEVTDFIRWTLSNDRDFSFKGRTAASMAALATEWHQRIQFAKLGKYVSWNGMGIENWELGGKNHIWKMGELLDNRELINEGRKQKHCVYSYVQRCVEGRSHIFSLRCYSRGIIGQDEEGEPIYKEINEINRVTVEISSREIVQVRGHLNKSASPEEVKILKLWAGEKGLAVRNNRF